MSARAMTFEAVDVQSDERRTLTPCLGLALAAGLLSWAALASLVGIVLA